VAASPAPWAHPISNIPRSQGLATTRTHWHHFEVAPPDSEGEFALHDFDFRTVDADCHNIFTLPVCSNEDRIQALDPDSPLGVMDPEADRTQGGLVPAPHCGKDGCF